MNEMFTIQLCVRLLELNNNEIGNVHKITYIIVLYAFYMDGNSADKIIGV